MLTRRSFGKLVTPALMASAWMLGRMRAEIVRDSKGTDPQFSVMMWTLNKYGTFEQNLDRVATAGYRHVELVNEFKSWSDEEMSRILTRMQTLGISVDATAGMKLGFADPSGGTAFLAELKSLIPVAKRLSCGQIILLSGKHIEGISAKEQHSAAIETLKRSAEALSKAGIVGVIEPIDRLENPSIYLDGVSEAFEIAEAVGSANIRVLYDIYHEQRGQGNLIEKLEKNIARVGLIHVADVPGRHEPGTGELNYSNIFSKLAQLQYTGVIAMEFYPTKDPVETLRHAREEALSSWRVARLK